MSERKAAEQALRVSEQQKHRFIDQMKRP